MNLKLPGLPLIISDAPKLSDSPATMIRKYAINEKINLLLFVFIVEFWNNFTNAKSQNKYNTSFWMEVLEVYKF